MSLLLSQTGQNMFSAGMLIASDERARAPLDRWSAGGRVLLMPWEDAVLWPRARALSGDPTAPMVPFGTGIETGRWESILDRADESGGQTMKKIIGTTRDSSGYALGSCIVQGFLTAGDIYVGEVTSDTAGYFVLPTIYAGAHYLVAYKAGSPDVAGTSANTIVPV